MGGFRPSPNFIPSNTQIGTLTSSNHQFTGSVDITGSLLINGVLITANGGGGTPGGSDTQFQYNNGGAFGGASGLIYDDANNRVGIGVADPDSKIEILSTTTQQKWSYDADSFATLTVADASELTVATGESGNLILDAGGDIRLNAAGGDISFRENAEVKLIFDMDTAGGTTKIYSGVAGDDLIFGTAPGGAGNVLTIKDDGKVGLGLNDPDSTLEIFSATTQQKWSYDADSFATLTVADDSDVTLATGENGDITLHAGPSGDIFLVADGGQVNFQNPLGDNKLAIDVENAGGLAYISNVKNNDLIFRVGTNVKEVFRLDQSEGALLMSGNFDNPGGLAPIHFRDTATRIHSPAFNHLAINAPTLEITGSTIFSGAFGNTDFETRSANFSILSPSGTSIIDTTGLGNNATYVYSIENGTIVGQEKKVFGKITFVQGNTVASNAIMFTGSNIEGTSPGGGMPPMAFLSGNAGTGGMSMVWSGSKWLTVGANNFVLQ